MQTYLASVAAYVDAGGAPASQKPASTQAQKVSTVRASTSHRSGPQPGVVVSFSEEALLAARESGMAEQMVDVRASEVERHKQQEREDRPEGGLRSEQELSSEEKQELAELKQRDSQVRTQDMARMAAAGGAAGGLTVEYETGPDGRRYAVAADVQLDTSPAATPERSLAKARSIRAAALSAGGDSSSDAAAAAAANAMEAKAQAEIAAARDGSQGQAAELPTGVDPAHAAAAYAAAS